MRRHVARLVHAPAEAVFSVLADGWLYPSWVVGAARMRFVSPEWPVAGALLHHSVGAWPLILINDTTELVAWHPPQFAVLRAQGGALGAAEVRIDVSASSTPGCCFVRLTELPRSGPVRGLRSVITQLLRVRNTESLRRLAAIAEGKARA